MSAMRNSMVTLSVLLMLDFGRASQSIDCAGKNIDVQTWNSSTLLFHMVMSKPSGDLFVGSVDNIYRLDSSLQLLDQASGKNETRKNINKLLVLNKTDEGEALIACGSLDTECPIRSVYNISDVIGRFDTPVTTDGAVVMFVGLNGVMNTFVACPHEGTGTHACKNFAGINWYVQGRNPEERLEKRPRFDPFNDIQYQQEVTLTKRFVDGFVIDDSLLFFSVQNTTSPGGGVLSSRVAHLCTKQSNLYRTYVDMKISCRDFTELTAVSHIQTSTGDYLIIAAFSKYFSDKSAKSALCVFKLGDVKKQLSLNVEQCYNGSKSSIDYMYRTPDRCPGGTQLDQLGDATERSRPEFFLCKPDILDLETMYGVIGDLSMNRDPVIQLSKVALTSLTTTRVGQTIVAFAGTNTGELKKIKVYPGAGKCLLSSDVTPDKPIKADMFVGPANQNVYFMTSDQVFKVHVARCSQYKSCKDCLDSEDPDCGWHMLEGRCGPNKSSVGDWISADANATCPKINSIAPSEKLDVNNMKETLLSLDQVPQADVTFTCVFSSENHGYRQTVKAISNRTMMQVKCEAPDVSNIKNSIKGFLRINLSLYMDTSSDQPFAEDDVLLYNCMTFSSCRSCTSRDWTCHWCSVENTCKQNTNMCVMPGIIDRSEEPAGSPECPEVSRLYLPTAMDNGTVFIHRNISTGVYFKGKNFFEPTSVSNKFSCKFLSSPVLYPATYLNDTDILCHVQTTAQIPNGLYGTNIELVVGQNNEQTIIDLHHSGSLDVTLYECSALVNPAENCGQCQSFKFEKPIFSCIWCAGQCNYKSACATQEKCPKPTITKVYPLSAHINASVNFTVIGYNLGSNLSTVQNAVTVAGERCTVLNFSASGSLTCLSKPTAERSKLGNVVIALPESPPVRSQDQIVFRVPVITDIEPKIGPLSGGSPITIIGKDLVTGRKQTASIGNIRCKTTRPFPNSESKLICETGSAASISQESLPVQVDFDDVQEESEKGLFKYIADPVITKIFPLKSFSGGGRLITVTGTNLHGIQYPKIYAIYEQETEHPSAPCVPVNSTTIHCRTPPEISNHEHNIRKRSIPDDTQSVQAVSEETTQKTPTIGFLMDDVMSVQNLRNSAPSLNTVLIYYLDPVIHSFSENQKPGEILSIKGERLRLAASEQDFVVLIGNENCNISYVFMESIQCVPPTEKPEVDNSTEGGTVPIVVKIGYIMYDQVGRLEYESARTGAHGEESHTLEYTVAAVVVTVLLIGLVVLGIGLYVNIRRRRVSDRENESLMYKMDKLESEYRTQCREEFAALQTAVSDLTSDLEGGKVLFRDYHLYAAKVLVPNGREHPVFSPPAGLNDGTSKAMDVLRGLLINSQFLYLMIKTLEQQRSFTIHDKSNVASMLIVVNEDNMEYITAMLKTLLNDLVDKTIAAQSAKILLRRSESVVEKLLTYWLSLCLYHYLQGPSGSSLYILYKAIKVQIEKGPVDYITCCGKYTLSEERLFTARDKDVNAHTLNLQVTHVETTLDVSVLDCDTITQAKSKMLDVLYKNIPYSQRPSVHHTGLEIREPDGSLKLLHDEDDTSEKEGVWKKINTLRHYDVPDSAPVRLTICSASDSTENILKLPESSPDKFIVGSLRRTKQVVRTISGSNFWHLMKQHSEEDDEVKLSSDLLLPRLLNTKGTLQQYIDDFFTEMLRVDEEPPFIIKYLFDFLDTAAARHSITDPDVLHTWKCNSLLLRFWVNTIKNPEFVFDVHKPIIVDSTLSVVAQALMDSCSTATLQLGKHSPVNKLLFAKEIPRYKEMVIDFFKKIADKPAVSDQDLNSYLTEKVSQKFSGQFNQTSALLELYKYVASYREQILLDLETSEKSNPGCYAPLISKLRDVYAMMGAIPREEETV